MRKLLMLGVAVSLVMSSCVKNISKDEIATPETTEVAVSIETNSLESQSSINKISGTTSKITKSGTFKRNNAPVYVSGVKVTAKFLDLTSTDVVKEFLFVDENTGGTDIKLNVPFGTNKFTAVSINNFEAKSNSYQDAITKATGTDAEKLAYYTDELIKIQPIYAIFNGERDYIVKENAKSLSIPMETKTARYSVVFETSDNYDITMSATLGSTTKSVLKATSAKASAIVFNDENVAAGQTLKVTLFVKVKGQTETVKTITTGTYTAEAGKNKTLVISYNKSGVILLQETNIAFTWTPMTNEGEVKDID